VLQDERRHVAVVRGERQRRTIGRESPRTGLGPLRIAEVEPRHRIESIVGAPRDSGRRRGLPYGHTGGLGWSVWDRRQRGGIEGIGLRDPTCHTRRRFRQSGYDRHQHITCRCGHGRIR
jgi:hypothetical protein